LKGILIALTHSWVHRVISWFVVSVPFLLNAQVQVDLSGRLLLKKLYHTSEYNQASLDSATVELQRLEAKEAQDADCVERERLKAIIAHGCARGGKSIALTSILEEEGACCPASGLYQYFLGCALIDAGQDKSAANRFQRAIELMEESDEATQPASVAEGVDLLRFLRNPDLSIHSKDFYHGHLYYELLLDTNLSEDEWVRNWEILKATNAFQRDAFSEYVNEFLEESDNNAVLNYIDSGHVAESKVAHWPIAFFMLLGFVAVLVCLMAMREIRKRREISEKSSIMTPKRESGENIDAPEGTSLMLEVTEEDISTLGHALQRGDRVGDAMIVVRKLENMFPTDRQSITLNSISSLQYSESLSHLEATIVLLTVRGIHAKEIAHQLNMSNGHLYNTRSIIRGKLEMPEDANFVTWIKKRIHSASST